MPLEPGGPGHAGPLGRLARALDRGPRHVDTQHPPPLPRQPDDVVAVAAAQVERGPGLQARGDLDEDRVRLARVHPSLAVALVPERLGRAAFGDRVRRLLLDQLGVDEGAGQEAAGGRGRDLGLDRGDVPGGVEPGDRGGPGRLGHRVRTEDEVAHGEVGDLDAQVAQQGGVRDGGRSDDEVPQGDDGARRQPDAGQGVVGRQDLDDLAVEEPDAAGLEAFAVLVAEGRTGVGEDGDVVAELAEQQRLVRGHRRRGQDADRGAARLVPVAVGAVQDVAPPARGEAGDRRQLVGQTGRHDDPGGPRPAARRRASRGTTGAGAPGRAAPDRSPHRSGPRRRTR